MIKIRLKLFLTLFLLFAISFLFNWMNINKTVRVSAASFSALSDTLSRNKTGALSSHTISFTTNHDIAAGDTVSIDFHEDESGFSVDGASTVAGDIDYNPDGAEATIVGMDGLCTGHTGTHDAAISINDSTGVLTIAHCYNWIYVYDKNLVNRAYAVSPVFEYGTAATTDGTGVNRVTNPSPAVPPENYVIDISSSWGDSGKLGVVIISEDQVGVSATVDPALSFSISDTAVGFGSFVGTAVRYATADATGSASGQGNGLPITLTASTNGINGLLISLYDVGDGGSAGLWSASPISELIPSAAANTTVITAGSKKYGAYGKNATNLTIDEGFDFDNSSDLAMSLSAQTLASASAPVSGATVDLAFIAAIDATTKAGAYTDTVTVICTGRY